LNTSTKSNAQLYGEEQTKKNNVQEKIKAERDALIETFKSEIESKRKETCQLKIQLTGCESTIKGKQDMISNDEAELVKEREQVRNCELLVSSYEKTITSLTDKIGKLKDSLKTIVCVFFVKSSYSFQILFLLNL
jgi:hypothetical protein